MLYTNTVLLYRFLLVTLLISSIGILYGIAIAAQVPEIVPVVVNEVESPPIRREVRLVIVPSEQPQVPDEVIASDVENINYDKELVKVGIAEKESASKEKPKPVEIKTDDSSVEITPKIPVIPEVSAKVFRVPFYSQFNDISTPSWQKVGCGIASLAMLISYYEKKPVSVDALLEEGISAGAYLDSDGWIHSGLIKLSQAYGLTGKSHSVADLGMDDAFAKLVSELKEGPVMASVHYTFEPNNPIPHLVVLNGVSDGKVFYNDPAESGGGHSLSVEKFEKGWKKRYIAIRPVS